MLRWTLVTLLAGAASALVAPVVPRPRSARATAAVPEKEDVELADCPVTQWGASIPDILCSLAESLLVLFCLSFVICLESSERS